MTLPTSGALTLENIQTEFGGSNPIGLNEYYAGGGLVPAGTSGTYGAVPSSGTLSVQNFYGTTAYTPIYVDEVFSTVGYTGNGAAQTVTTGVNLQTHQGLLWIKSRNATYQHALFTPGGPGRLYSDSNGTPDGTTVLNVNTTGFTINTNFPQSNNFAGTNNLNTNYVSWSFRKKPKFFDVVRWTGNGAATQTINHSLDTAPGCIMVKAISGNDANWIVYHRGLTTPDSKFLRLNTTDSAFITSSQMWAPTTTNFTVYQYYGLNDLNVNYVAYLFAHNAGGFGLTGTDNVISCGSYVCGSTSPQDIEVGFEPQWLLIKNVSRASSWVMADCMRGMYQGLTDGSSNYYRLYANSSSAETLINWVSPTPTGFNVGVQNNYDTWGAGDTFIYIAVRSRQMRPPTSGSSVFNPIARTGTGANGIVDAGIFVDTVLSANYALTSTRPRPIYDRIRPAWASGNGLLTSSTGTIVGRNGIVNFDVYNGYRVDPESANGDTGSLANKLSVAYIQYVFTRSRGFYDQRVYMGTGAAQTLTHNLGVTPQLIITKPFSTTGSWTVTAPDSVGNLLGNTLIDAAFGNFQFVGNLNASTVSAGFANAGYASTSGVRYVMYLFASYPGVSKIAYYTGNGSSQTINCGFSAGARFILIKRSDSAGGWYIWDSARGIVSGNDSVISLNNGTVQNTTDDSIDPTSSGFVVNQTAVTNINVSGGTYFYFAVA